MERQDNCKCNCKDNCKLKGKLVGVERKSESDEKDDRLILRLTEREGSLVLRR